MTYDSPFKGAGWLMALGALSTLGYLYLFRLSFGALAPGSQEGPYITQFLVVYFMLFALYLCLIVPIVRRPGMDRRHLWFGIAFGLLFRAIMLPGDLILENDIYRYMWDGHMQHQGVNPFQYAPLESETEAYRTDYWQAINYPYVPTIYPPTLQFVFFLSEAVYPGSIVGMKFFLTIFDGATIFLILMLLEKLRKPPEWCLIYAWSPLVIKEIANSGHADSVSACLLTGFFLLIAHGRAAQSAVALAAMTLTKFFGILLLPLLHRHWTYWAYVAYFITIFVLYGPFLAPNVNPFEGFFTFSNEWLFNAGPYAAVEWALMEYSTLNWEDSARIARYAMFVVVIATLAWQSLRLIGRREPEALLRAAFIVLGTLLVCSPVVNCWYLVWLVPLMCVFPMKSWIAFTGLVYLSYTYYYDYSFAWWVKPVEYGVFFFLLLDDALPWRPRRRTAPVEESKESETDDRTLPGDSSQ